MLVDPKDIQRVVDDAIAEDRVKRGDVHGITKAEHRSLIAVAEYPSQVKAAEALGISVQTLKNNLATGKRRLQASNLLDAYQRLGWLVLPGDHRIKHPPGEAHVYKLDCMACGQAGVLRVSIDPERAP